MKKYLLLIVITLLSTIGALAGSGVVSTAVSASSSQLGAPVQKLTFLNHRKVALISQKQGEVEKRLCQYATQQECYLKDPKCSTGDVHHYGCAVCSDGISWKCVPL
jgi:hypothetical protein